MIFKGGSRISSQVGPTTSPRLESRWVGVDIVYIYFKNDYYSIYIYVFKVSGSYFRLDDDIQGRIQDFKSGGPNDLSQIGKSVGGCGYCLHIFQKRLL